ncbi:MAG: carboxypeptidase-like regulatory domain-containing protein [Tannerella sp.]|jgi:hypothetical protein|nr:carboxypeptidase-like regulatory domain-containing protein [Tannerella sp.]
MPLKNYTVIVISFLLLTNYVFAPAQTNDNGKDFVTISGIVKDRRTNRNLESVNISMVGTRIGTVTNADGRFSLKIKSVKPGDVLEISCMGYQNVKIPVPADLSQELAIHLTQSSILLKEIIVLPNEAKKLVMAAMERIETNYSLDKNRMTGFYRETVQKGRRYINISEAVTELYKTPYIQNVSADRVQILKGRSLLSPKASDTLAVKLRGGPNLAVICDFVKNPDMLFEKEIFDIYNFVLNDPVSIDDREQYTILFEPIVTQSYAMYYGVMYIDKETLTFTRAEFYLDMSDLNKATSSILYKKPIGLRFKPEELSITVSYKRHGERSYLNYVRNEIRFKCDWKRRLFATNYTVISESVVTDIKETDIESITYKDSFKTSQILSDKVSNFYDENFWEDYNIIEPSESLEDAVNKLKKKYD